VARRPSPKCSAAVAEVLGGQDGSHEERGVRPVEDVWVRRAVATARSRRIEGRRFGSDVLVRNGAEIKAVLTNLVNAPSAPGG